MSCHMLQGPHGTRIQVGVVVLREQMVHHRQFLQLVLRGTTLGFWISQRQEFQPADSLELWYQPCPQGQLVCTVVVP